MEGNGRVLVLGDDNRSCLTVVRSLGRRGLEVWLGTETPGSIVPRSRYVARTILLPPQKTASSGPVEEFRLCYAEVAAGVDGVIEAVKG